MRILCTSIDLPGHLDWGGYLKTASALQRRGHDIWWGSGKRVERAVTRAGIPFAALQQTGWRHQMPPLAAELSAEEREAARRERALAVWLSPEPVLQALAELQALADEIRPDIILAEPYMAAGVLLAERMGTPLVVAGRPALPPATLAGAATASIAALCEAAGAPGAYWDMARGTPRSPHLHLDFFCRSWYADILEISPQTHFCGGALAAPSPDLPAALARKLDPERPLALVTLGTTFARDETFFRLAAESALMIGAQALLVTGRNAPDMLASLREAPPGRSIVVDWIDYARLFPHLAFVVHHGGVATTHAALLHGVPQVVVPHAGDQYPQAARVTQAEVGYGIRPRDFTLANVPMILSDILSLPEFRKNAAALAAEMQALGGSEAAARAVEEV